MPRLPPPPPGWSRRPVYWTHTDFEGEYLSSTHRGWEYTRDDYRSPALVRVFELVEHGRGRLRPGRFVATVGEGGARASVSSEDPAYTGARLDAVAFLAYAEARAVQAWHRGMTDPDVRVETWEARGRKGGPDAPHWLHTETGLSRRDERMHGGEGTAVLCEGLPGPVGYRSAVGVTRWSSSSPPEGFSDRAAAPEIPAELTDNVLSVLHGLGGDRAVAEALGLIRERF